MWPIVALATEEILRLVPQELREGALALGIPAVEGDPAHRDPDGGRGLFTAIMLAVARGLGETAPILLTALGNDYINTEPERRPTRCRCGSTTTRAPRSRRSTLRLGGALVLLAGCWSWRSGAGPVQPSSR